MKTRMHNTLLRQSIVLVTGTLMCLVLHGNSAVRAADNIRLKAQPAAPRQVVSQSFISSKPIFACRANTLDPVEWSRMVWKGYISKKADPWGMTPDLKPMLRFSFDCRALPWPSIKHSAVDSLDNNGRGVGPHALLHAMLGDEKKNDPAEQGQMAYLQWHCDPESGLAYTDESMRRGCPMPEGEMTNNLILLYQYTGQKAYKDWAAKLINTFRKYAIVTDRPGIGPVASYAQGGVTPGDLPAGKVTNVIDPGYYPPGWNVIAFSRWYELTGDKSSLDFAVALANRLCNSEDPDGEDGCLRPDGSFGGKRQKNGLGLHMHTHTHCLPGLLHLGEQLAKAGRKDQALKFIGQAKSTFDWLYDPAHNPDAGSLTGWLGEWLMVATGWDRQSDCEGCTMGDVVQTACSLGAASRLVPSLASYVDYYDRAEQMFTGQLVEQTFRLTPTYLKILRQCIEKRVAKKVIPIGPKVSLNTMTGSGTITSSLEKLHLEPGIYTINVEADGAHPFMLDYAEVKGPQGTARYESETWMGCTQSDLSEGSRARVTPGSWQGDRYNMCGSDITSGLPDGAKIAARIPIEVTSDGLYSLKASVVKSNDVGIIDFAVDGRNVGSIDCYQSQPNTGWSLENACQVNLTAGRHMVTLTWTNGKKNPSSVKSNVFCDYITLDGGRTKYDLEKYCQDGAYSIKDKMVYGWTLNSDSDNQPGFSGSAMSYFVNAGSGYSVRIPFIVNVTGDYEVSVAGIHSLANSNGIVSACVSSSSRSDKVKQKEVETGYSEAVKTAERMVGQQLGACGFPDWVNQLPSDLDADLPGIHMQGCCADATIRAAYAIWSETVTGTSKEARVNMAFNRDSSLVKVISCLPHRGELDVIVKSAKRVLVRIPSWTPKDKVKVYVNKKSRAVRWDGRYVLFDRTRSGQQLTVTYPLRVAQIKETPGSLAGTEFTEKWRGNTIVDISPRGKWIPMFNRPELNTEVVP